MNTAKITQLETCKINKLNQPFNKLQSKNCMLENAKCCRIIENINQESQNAFQFFLVIKKLAFHLIYTE